MTEKTALDAVQEALADVAKAESSEPVFHAEPPAGEPPAEPAQAEGEPAAEPVVEPPAEPVAEPPEPPAAEPPVEPASAAGEPEKPAAKPSDEFGDLPENTNAKTKERFGALKERFDSVATERDTFKADLEKANARIDDMVNVVRSTGATGEQFNMALTYIEAVNSKDPAKLEKAFEFLKSEMGALAKILGKDGAPGVDPLEAHPDLQKEVEDGGMTRKYAVELAAARAAGVLRKTTDEETARATTQKRELDSAIADISTLGKRLRAENAEKFQANVKVLEQIVELVQSSGKPPKEWAKIIEDAWKRIPAPSVASAKPRVPAPLRPGGNTGGSGPSGMRKEPGSAIEAVNMALGI